MRDGMVDREKVIEHITDCVRIADRQTNHNWVFVRTETLKDAIALLKAQESRVMALEELRMHEVYWCEQENVSRPWPIAMHHIRNAGLLDGPVYQDYMGDNFNTKEYGVKWRCWTSRPSDEVREATPWN